MQLDDEAEQRCPLEKSDQIYTAAGCNYRVGIGRRTRYPHKSFGHDDPAIARELNKGTTGVTAPPAAPWAAKIACWAATPDNSGDGARHMGRGDSMGCGDPTATPLDNMGCADAASLHIA